MFPTLHATEAFPLDRVPCHEVFRRRLYHTIILLGICYIHTLHCQGGDGGGLFPAGIAEQAPR